MIYLIFFILYSIQAAAVEISAIDFLKSCPVQNIQKQLKEQIAYTNKQDNRSAFNSLNPSFIYSYSNNDFGASTTDRVRYGVQFNHINPFTISNQYKRNKYLNLGAEQQFNHLTRKALLTHSQLLLEWAHRYKLHNRLGFIIDLKRNNVSFSELSQNELKSIFIEDSYIEDLMMNKERLSALSNLFSKCGLSIHINHNPLNVILPSLQASEHRVEMERIKERELKSINSFCENEKKGQYHLLKGRSQILDPGLFASFNKVAPQNQEEYNEWRIGIRLNINFENIGQSASRYNTGTTQCDLNKDTMIIDESNLFNAAIVTHQRISNLKQSMKYMDDKITGFKVAFVNHKINKEEIKDFVNQYTSTLFKLTENMTSSYGLYLASKVD